MYKRDCFFYDEDQDMSATLPECKYDNTWGTIYCEGCPNYFDKQAGISIIRQYVNELKSYPKTRLMFIS